MDQKTRRTVIVIGALVTLFLVFTSTVDIYTDWLWFASLGQLSTYQTRLWTRAGLWLAGALLVMLVLAINWLLIPRRLLGKLQLHLRDRQQQSFTISSGVRGWRGYPTSAPSVTIILRVVAALITLVMASEVSARWMTFLTFRHAASFGLSDPIFGLDVSFYVFKLPLYRFVVGWLLGLITVTLLGSTLVYLFAQQIRGRMAMTHLSILGALFLAGKAVDYQLQRFALLDSSRGVVFGAGYTDVHARLLSDGSHPRAPADRHSRSAPGASALLLLVNIIVRRWRLLLIAGGAAGWRGYPTSAPSALALSILTDAASAPALSVIRTDVVYPAALQGATQRTGSLRGPTSSTTSASLATPTAWKASRNPTIKSQACSPWSNWRPTPTSSTTCGYGTGSRAGWQPSARTTYEQLQEIRTYYTFADVDADRAYAA